MTVTYKDAGVDIDAGDELVKRIAPIARSTRRPGTIDDIGGFGGLFSLGALSVENPVLVASTDGVGTKLAIAQAMRKHDTIGIDLVAMCANDVVVCGAEPIFFLDYLATGKLDVAQAEQIVSGIAEGCRQAGCALLGGETAEMPGFYPAGSYDVAGFCVGVASQDALLGAGRVKAGDVLVGVESSGLHSNGYSLARKVLGEKPQALEQYQPELGCTLGEELLRPTRIYVKPALEAIAGGGVRALCHVTGGGIPGNLSRVIPEGLYAIVDRGVWNVPPVFGLIQQKAGIDDSEMFRTFNMGIGLIAIVEPAAADRVSAAFAKHGLAAQVVGKVAEATGPKPEKVVIRHAR